MDLVSSLFLNGRVAAAQQRLAEATTLYEEALAKCRRLRELAVDSPRSRRMLQGVLRALIEVERRQGHAERAAELEAERSTVFAEVSREPED